jgi:transglutaminase-like putative cysteine protease
MSQGNPARQRMQRGTGDIDKEEGKDQSDCVDEGKEAHLDTNIALLNLIDHKDVDWKRVQRTAYLIHQHLRYEYPGPIDDLHQVLIIVPPDHYGDQRLIVHRLEVSTPGAEISSHQDEFGNLILTPFVPHIEEAVDFEAWIVVERTVNNEPHYLPASSLTDSRYLDFSKLTQPNDVLRDTAEKLKQEGLQGEQLARRINEWTYHALRYEHGVTQIRTTAVAALALGRGVCQDFAHVMLVLCRLCGLPSRYVSGHMLGEGGTHAWVEVLLPVPSQPDKVMILPLDPTHNRATTLSYITIAVGRDYLDVAPTSGTYRAAYAGQLSAYKHVGLTSLEYVE